MSRIIVTGGGRKPTKKEQEQENLENFIIFVLGLGTATLCLLCFCIIYYLF